MNDKAAKKAENLIMEDNLSGLNLFIQMNWIWNFVFFSKLMFSMRIKFIII